MSTYAKTESARRRIEREHFMMFHWLHFAECRTWSTAEMVSRLKAEGLLAQSTNAIDCVSVNRFWRDLKASCK